MLAADHNLKIVIVYQKLTYIRPCNMGGSESYLNRRDPIKPGPFVQWLKSWNHLSETFPGCPLGTPRIQMNPIRVLSCLLIPNHQIQGCHHVSCFAVLIVAYRMASCIFFRLSWTVVHLKVWVVADFITQMTSVCIKTTSAYLWLSWVFTKNLLRKNCVMCLSFTSLDIKLLLLYALCLYIHLLEILIPPPGHFISLEFLKCGGIRVDFESVLMNHRWHSFQWIEYTMFPRMASAKGPCAQYSELKVKVSWFAGGRGGSYVVRYAYMTYDIWHI